MASCYYLPCWTALSFFAVIPALVAIPLIIFVKYNYRSPFSMLFQEFMKSFKKFVIEAVLKPWQPLGMDMFCPCSSDTGFQGNWKGALQQWLVIHLYQLTLVLLVFIMSLIYWEAVGWAFTFAIYIPLLVFLTWHFWFALTERNPTGFPASVCGILWGLHS